MTASEWTTIGISVSGAVISLLVYIIQFLHRMDKRGAVDTATIKDHGHRIGRLENVTSELKTQVTKLEVKQ
jgi:hypothetical protein